MQNEVKLHLSSSLSLSKARQKTIGSGKTILTLFSANERLNLALLLVFTASSSID